MVRLALMLSLGLLCSPAAAVTCAEIQAALHVPPPPVGDSEDPDGTLICSRAALAMFEINKIALEKAQAPADLSALHGTWLGDRVLPYISGITVPGQEVLVIGPGDTAETLRMTQYWMKAATPRGVAPLWSEDGRYQGVTAEVTLERKADGTFAVAGFGEEIVYGDRQLEFERSHDLWVKTELNHFELPLELRLHEDVVVLDGALRNPVTRQPRSYARSYTRVAPGAPETALAVVAVGELSQGRNFDCLAHQISDGNGPLFEALAPNGLAELDGLLRALIGFHTRRDVFLQAMRKAETPAEREALKQGFIATSDAYTALIQDPGNKVLMAAIVEESDSFCPDFF